MTATTKEITDKLVDMMTNAHLKELNKLVRRKQIENKLAIDMNYAYGEGAKHMLHHLVQIGIVEYVSESELAETPAKMNSEAETAPETAPETDEPTGEPA